MVVEYKTLDKCIKAVQESDTSRKLKECFTFTISCIYTLHTENGSYLVYVSMYIPYFYGIPIILRFATINFLFNINTGMTRILFDFIPVYCPSLASIT